MSLDGDKRRVDPRDIDALWAVCFPPHQSCSVEHQRWELGVNFGEGPLPPELVDATLAAAPDTEGAAALVWKLAQLRGKEIRPWVERYLQSPDLGILALAALGLCEFDEAAGVAFLRSIVQEIEHNGPPFDTVTGPLYSIQAGLREVESPLITEFKKQTLGKFYT